MKLLLLLLLPALAQAQDILPNANTIVVKGVSFQQVCMALLDKGYSIEKKDSELQTVRTEKKDYPKYWNATFIINIRVKDSTAYITGEFTAPPGGGIYNKEPFYNFTTKKGKSNPKSIISYPFYLANELALSLGREVSYLKQ